MTKIKPITIIITLILLSISLSVFGDLNAGEEMKKQVLSNGAIEASSTSYGMRATLVQTGIGFVNSTSYGVAQGFWGAQGPSGCCGQFVGGFTGNTNCSNDGKRNLADVSILVDHVFLSKAPLCCHENGNVEGDPEGKHNLADVVRLIDNIFLTKAETEPCL